MGMWNRLTIFYIFITISTINVLSVSGRNGFIPPFMYGSGNIRFPLYSVTRNKYFLPGGYQRWKYHPPGVIHIPPHYRTAHRTSFDQMMTNQSPYPTFSKKSFYKRQQKQQYAQRRRSLK